MCDLDVVSSVELTLFDILNMKESRTHFALSLTRNLVELVPWSIAATSGSMAPLFCPSKRLEKRAVQQQQQQLSRAKHSRVCFFFFFSLPHFFLNSQWGGTRPRAGGGGSTRKFRDAAPLLAASEKASSYRWPIGFVGSPPPPFFEGRSPKKCRVEEREEGLCRICSLGIH